MNDNDINHDTETTAPATVWIMVCGGGLLLLIGAGMMTALSPMFIYGKLYEQRPVIAMVAVYLVAWIGYVLIFARSRAAGRSRSLFWVAMVCALAARLLMCFSSPLLENDFYRYMWDGMVVNHKVSPYATAPQFYDVTDIEPDPEQFEAALTDNTRAAILTHLGGIPIEMGPIVEIAAARGIRIVEDCSQAHGALYRGKRVGRFGDIAAFSTGFPKNRAPGKGSRELPNLDPSNKQRSGELCH